jgi:hypothetical protein
MISSKAKNIDDILDFLDWGNSKDGFLLMAIGQQGINYNSYDFDTKLIDRTPEQAEKFATQSSSYTSIAFTLYGAPAIIENGDTPARAKLYNDAYENLMATTKIVELPVVNAVTCPKLINFGTTNPDDVKARDETFARYITGDISRAQLESYLNNQYFPRVAEAEKEYVDYMNSLKQ